MATKKKQEKEFATPQEEIKYLRKQVNAYKGINTQLSARVNSLTEEVNRLEDTLMRTELELAKKEKSWWNRIFG